MIFSEQNFRKLCRTELGGFESRKFQEALDANPADPVPIIFEVGFMETKTVMVSRIDAEQYARWAKEESTPETEILKYIKPQMHRWILNNRPGMCEYLKDAIARFNPEYNTEVQIIWPIETPDVVPFEAAERYVRKYEQSSRP